MFYWFLNGESGLISGSQRSAHFIDPALRGILESSLTPDDNDIFLTNVINKPVLVIHGSVQVGFQ